MKKQFLLKSWLMLCMLMVGIGAWAEEQTATLTFTAACGGSGTDDKGNSWTVTSDASESTYDATKGIHYGTGSAAVSYLTLTNSSITGTISKIVVNASGASSTSAKIDVKVGGSAFGSQQSLTSSNAAYTFNGSASGNIEISITQTSAKKALYVKSVAVTYSTAADTRTAVNMTGFSATSATLIKGDNTTTSVTNDQNGWTPSYTYESSNTSVATVSNTGVITAVAKGTARITASLDIANDDENWKKGATTSATIDITVNNPSHTAHFSVNGTIDPAKNVTVEEGSAITFPANPEVSDVVFKGWATAAIDGTQDNAPSFVNTATETMGTNDVTYYAVFAVEEGEPAAETKTQTLQYDTWTYSGSTTNKNGYRLFHSGSYIESASFDRSKLCKVVVFGGTFGGTSNNKLTIGDGTNTWKSVTVSGSSETGVNTYTDGTALTGTGTIRITSNSGSNSGSGTGVRISKVDIYTMEGGYTYSDYCTTVKAVTGVAVKTAPTTVAYCEGEKFNPAGLEVTLTYDDETTKDVAYTDATASKFTFAPALNAALTTSDDHVAITINGQTANQTISVRSVSISAPVVAEGTYTVKVGDAAAVTADGNTINALKGQKIVLASTPAAGYKVASTAFVVTDEDDANVSVSTAGGQYSFTMPSKNVTITAQFTRVYTITAGSCEHGSITAIKDKDDAEITETSKGSKVVVEATADTHYHLTGMYYVKENEETQNVINENEGVYSFTMPQSNVTVYATFADDTQYTISWMVNGAEAKSEQVYADVPVSAPAVVPVNGKAFRGWVAEEIVGTTNDAPSFVNVTNLTVNEDKVFYAVFATEEGTPETHNIITYETENFPTSYAAAADYTFNGESFNLVQAYVNGEKTQWRAAGNSNGTGAMYNKDAMNLSKITLTYDNSDSYKNFTVKVGNSANPTEGTAITPEVDANNNKVYVFDCSSENASYFVLTNGTNAGYLASIDITCGGATYSDYCTTVAAPTTTTINITTPEGYSTFVCDQAYVMPEGFMGSAATVTDNKLTWGWEYQEGDVVPANTPLLIYGTEVSAEAVLTTGGDAPATNYLVANTTGATAAASTLAPVGSSKFYVLSYDTNNENLGFYWLTEDGSSFNVPAGKVFLAVPAGVSAKCFVLDGDATSIESIENVTANSSVAYNLNGQRVNANAKGIVIVNGKKYLNK